MKLKNYRRINNFLFWKEMTSHENQELPLKALQKISILIFNKRYHEHPGPFLMGNLAS